jgi:hypothetical protein
VDCDVQSALNLSYFSARSIYITWSDYCKVLRERRPNDAASEKLASEKDSLVFKGPWPFLRVSNATSGHLCYDKTIYVTCSGHDGLFSGSVVLR